VKMQGRNVWIGAFFTGVLFTIGKTLTGLYLAKSAVASSYDAAGFLVIILLWVYYSSVILFLGAEFTQVYTQQKNKTGGLAYMTLEEETEKKLVNIDTELSAGPPETKTINAVPHNSLLLSAARFSGYQTARIQNSIKPVKENVEKKWKASKWIYRIVDLIGFKRSAKLTWKGYKVKRKVEALTESKESQDQIHSEP
jgi:Virulence factor BrkB